MSKEARKYGKSQQQRVEDEINKFTHTLKYVSEKLENKIPFENLTIQKLGLEKSEKGGPIDIGASGGGKSA